MEALHACSVAALTIYDMCKSADRAMAIGELASGRRPAAGQARAALATLLDGASLRKRRPRCPDARFS